MPRPSLKSVRTPEPLIRKWSALQVFRRLPSKLNQLQPGPMQRLHRRKSQSRSLGEPADGCSRESRQRRNYELPPAANRVLHALESSDPLGSIYTCSSVSAAGRRTRKGDAIMMRRKSAANRRRSSRWRLRTCVFLLRLVNNTATRPRCTLSARALHSPLQETLRWVHRGHVRLLTAHVGNSASRRTTPFRSRPRRARESSPDRSLTAKAVAAHRHRDRKLSAKD